MKNKKILITGNKGFIGNSILEKLRRMANKFDIWLGKFKNEFEDDDNDNAEEELKVSVKKLNKKNLKLLAKIANGNIVSFSKMTEMFSTSNSKSPNILKKFIAILMAQSWTREINRNISLYQIASQQWNNEFTFHQISLISVKQCNNDKNDIQKISDISKDIDEPFYDFNKFKREAIIVIDNMPQLIPHDMKSIWQKTYDFYSLDIINNIIDSDLIGGKKSYKIYYS